MWGNGGRNIKLDQAKFTDMDSLSRDSAFSLQLGKSEQFGWLAG